MAGTLTTRTTAARNTFRTWGMQRVSVPLNSHRRKVGHRTHADVLFGTACSSDCSSYFSLRRVAAARCTPPPLRPSKRVGERARSRRTDETAPWSARPVNSVTPAWPVGLRWETSGVAATAPAETNGVIAAATTIQTARRVSSALPAKTTAAATPRSLSESAAWTATARRAEG